MWWAASLLNAATCSDSSWSLCGSSSQTQDMVSWLCPAAPALGGFLVYQPCCCYCCCHIVWSLGRLRLIMVDERKARMPSMITACLAWLFKLISVTRCFTNLIRLKVSQRAQYAGVIRVILCSFSFGNVFTSFLKRKTWLISLVKMNSKVISSR